MHKQAISKEVAAALAAHGMSADDLLRKALNIEPAGAKGGGWTCKGVTFPEGTYFRTWYRDRPFWGEVKNGALWIKDERFTSPSAAAAFVFGRQINGWDVWECLFPRTKDWLNIGELRRHNDEAGDPDGPVF